MNINKTNLSALVYNGKETTYFDDSLKGFAVRVGKTSSSYIVMYRNAYGKQKKLTIAKTTQITPTQAREEKTLRDLQRVCRELHDLRTEIHNLVATYYGN